MAQKCLYGVRQMEVRIKLDCFNATPNSGNVTELQSSIQFEPGFTATTILHPATYLNKILVGSSQGSLQLWNIRTQYVPHSL